MTTLHLSTAARNAAVNAVVLLIDGGTSDPGKIEIYGGTIAATPATAPATSALATLTFSDPAFLTGSTANGTVAADSITPDTDAAADGTATWARILDGDDNVIMDVDVGLSDATLVLNTVTIVAGGTVSITSANFTMPSGI
jgi:hypothetical protein